jgi:hypothetical protein
MQLVHFAPQKNLLCLSFPSFQRLCGTHNFSWHQHRAMNSYIVLGVDLVCSGDRGGFISPTAPNASGYPLITTPLPPPFPLSSRSEARVANHQSRGFGRRCDTRSVFLSSDIYFHVYFYCPAHLPGHIPSRAKTTKQLEQRGWRLGEERRGGGVLAWHFGFSCCCLEALRTLLPRTCTYVTEYAVSLILHPSFCWLSLCGLPFPPPNSPPPAQREGMVLAYGSSPANLCDVPVRTNQPAYQPVKPR